MFCNGHVNHLTRIQLSMHFTCQRQNACSKIQAEHHQGQSPASGDAHCRLSPIQMGLNLHGGPCNLVICYFSGFALCFTLCLDEPRLAFFLGLFFALVSGILIILSSMHMHMSMIFYADVSWLWKKNAATCYIKSCKAYIRDPSLNIKHFTSCKMKNRCLSYAFAFIQNTIQKHAPPVLFYCCPNFKSVYH